MSKMTEEFKTLKSKYENACNEIVMLFCKKQDMRFEYWVADCVGTIALIGDYFFQMEEIMIDLQLEAPQWVILEWYDLNIEAHTKKENFPNYENYVKYAVKQTAP